MAGLDTLIWELQEQDHGIVLAHPERCPAFQRDVQMLESLVHGGGVLTSITAGSLVGRFGRTVRRFALSLFEAELVHNVASDAHDASERRPGMAAELQQAGLEPLTDWLTERCRRAILAGEETIPPAPAALGAASRRRRRGVVAPRTAQASFVIAMTMPITTNTTIAICIQIQVGDMPPDSVLRAGASARAAAE